MKRRALVKHLTRQGCVFLREGGRHTVYENPSARRISTVPRHSEIEDGLARKICKDLAIPLP